jgi:Helix-turn-helix domain of transposase family ISL3
MILTMDIDLNGLTATQLKKLQAKIADKQREREKLPEDVNAVRELVKKRGWRSLEAFLLTAGFTGKVEAKKAKTKGAGKRHRMTDEDRAALEESIKEGKMSIAEVAKKHGVSTTTVMTAKKKLKLVKSRQPKK